MEIEEQAEEIKVDDNKEWKRKIPAVEKERTSNLPYKLPTKLIEILDGLKWAIHFKKQSGVIIVDGRSGMGKTTISLQIGKYMSQDFNIEDIHFTPESFLEGLTKIDKGKTIIFDEAMLLSSRSALSAINRMVVIAMSMIRSKNIIVIFNVNSIFDLDRNLALSRADLLIHCYGDSLTDKGKFLAFFKGADGMDRIKQLYINGKKFYSYSTPKSNFNSNFSAYFAVDEAEYERRKQVGVNNFLKGKGMEKVNKSTMNRNMLICNLAEKGEYTYAKIADMCGISEDAVGNIVRKHKELLILEGKVERFNQKEKGFAFNVEDK